MQEIDDKIQTGRMEIVDMSSMMDIVEADPHSLLQKKMAQVAAVNIKPENLDKHYNKNPSAHTKDFVELFKADKEFKREGFGNAASQNLTININNINNLGLSGKMKLREEINREIEDLKARLGLGKKPEPIALQGNKDDKE